MPPWGRRGPRSRWEGGHGHRRSGDPVPSASWSPGTGGGRACGQGWAQPAVSLPSWARAPRRACGSAARTCCSRCLWTQVSFRRFAAAFPRRRCALSASPPSPTHHLGLARCPCRCPCGRDALRFSGWSLEQEAGLSRRTSLSCPWDGDTQSVPLAPKGSGDKLGGGG